MNTYQHQSIRRLMDTLRTGRVPDLGELTKPDLLTELRDCAVALDEAATLVAVHFPNLAKEYRRKASRAREMARA